MQELVLEEQEMVYRRVVQFEEENIVISDQEWRENWIDENGNEGDMWVEDFMVRIPKREIAKIFNHKAF